MIYQPKRLYDLKLRDQRKHVKWDGIDAEDAARRYVGSHPDACVIATRLADEERHGVFGLGGDGHRFGVTILAPGERGWDK